MSVTYREGHVEIVKELWGVIANIKTECRITLAKSPVSKPLFEKEKCCIHNEKSHSGPIWNDSIDRGEPEMVGLLNRIDMFAQSF